MTRARYTQVSLDATPYTTASAAVYGGRFCVARITTPGKIMNTAVSG